MTDIQEEGKVFLHEGTHWNSYFVRTGILPVSGKDYDRIVSLPRQNVCQKEVRKNGK